MTDDNVFCEDKQSTALSFKEFEAYESLNIVIETDYDAGNSIYTLYVYKIKRPEFNFFNRSEN